MFNAATKTVHINPYHAGYFYELHSSPIGIQSTCGIPFISVFTSRVKNIEVPDLDLHVFKTGYIQV